MPGIVVLHGDAYAYEELSLGDDAAHGITAANLSDGDQPSHYALLTVSVHTINFTLDGTAPTAEAGTGVGHPMVAGTSYIIEGHNNIRNFKAINRVAGSDGEVRITLFTRG